MGTLANVRGDSAEFRRLNPHLFTPEGAQKAPKALISANPSPVSPQKGIRTAPEPKTSPERSMAAWLRRQQSEGQVLLWRFEGVCLQTGGSRYTPDFAVWRTNGTFVLIEVKGPYIRDDALVKFKLMSAGYPEAWARFELWQLKKDGWTQLV